MQLENWLRRVELDVLWIQEQQARRLLPLRKVSGPRTPSDMMTKNVDQAHIDLYLDLLNLIRHGLSGHCTEPLVDGGED